MNITMLTFLTDKIKNILAKNPSLTKEKNSIRIMHDLMLLL